MFLCLSCADVTPGALIVTVGAALDDGDEVTAAAGIDEAVGLLNGG